MLNFQRRTFALSIAAAGGLGALGLPASAQEKFPERPIRILVPFGAGGSADAIARIVGDGLAQQVGQPVIVENKPGAAGNVGTSIAAKAPADGYNLLLGGTPNMSINPSLYSNAGFDPEKDFAAIAMFASAPNIIVVNPALPVKSLSDLIAYSKTQADGISYTTAGVGGTGHLTGEMIAAATGAKMLHVPDASPLTLVMGGHVQACIYTVGATVQHVAAGRLRALAVTSKRRLSLAPDVPTIVEAGFPNLVATAWYGFVAPAAIAPAIRATLSDAVLKAANSPAVRAKLEALACDVTTLGAADFAEYMHSERQLWAQAVKRSGAKAG